MLSSQKTVSVAAMIGVLLSLTACADLPNYKAKAVRDAIEGEGLSIQLQQEAQDRFQGLPVMVNSPSLTFNVVTVDKNFLPGFSFSEAQTGYLWNHYFTQKALVEQFVSNTNLAMNAMEIPLTAQKQRYALDITVIKATFTAQFLKQGDLDKGYKQFMLGHLETAYRITDTSTRNTVFEQSYEVTDTRFLPTPGQKEQVSAALLYQMMTDSSIKFGKDIAQHCAFYAIPSIECR